MDYIFSNNNIVMINVQIFTFMEEVITGGEAEDGKQWRPQKET